MYLAKKKCDYKLKYLIKKILSTYLRELLFSSSAKQIDTYPGTRITRIQSIEMFITPDVD